MMEMRPENRSPLKRRADQMQSLEEKLAQLRKEGKQKFSDLRDRELEKFMTPGQRKRENIRRGKRRAKQDKKDSRDDRS